MNHLYYNPIVVKPRRALKAIALILAFFLSFVTSSYAQLFPELTFQNPQLISGTDKADGAVYRFSNVATGIDALVTIVGRSHPNPGGVNPVNYVAILNMDITSTGPANAFQPDVAFVGDYTNQDWWADFSVHFVAAGTSSELPTGSGIIYKATAYDIDGDGHGVREYIQAFGPSSYQTNPGTQLTVSPVSRTYNSISYSGTEFLGPMAEVGTFVDVNAAEVSVTLSYVNQNTIYFRTGGRNATTNFGDPDRFYSILFKDFLYLAPGPLPVDLMSFNAKLHKNLAVLDWTTANEKSFSHFAIQRSADGKSFTDIATVAGKQSSGSANTLYTYTDNTPVPNAVVYYRLKMVDIDGKYKYSDIEIVNGALAQNQSSSLSVYPNPVVSELRVTIPDSWQGKKVSYTIYNVTGNLVVNKVVNNAGQTEPFNLSASAAGLYIIKVAHDAETITKQIVKR